MSENWNCPTAFLVSVNIELQQKERNGSWIRPYMESEFIAPCKLGSLSIDMSHSLELNRNLLFRTAIKYPEGFMRYMKKSIYGLILSRPG
jgi:hypothetical protein